MTCCTDTLGMPVPCQHLTATACPICGEDTVIRLPDDWQAQVEAGAAIPIIGCGNPWHYATIDAARSVTPDGLREAAQAVVDAWDADDQSLGWNADTQTDLVDALRAALAHPATPPRLDRKRLARAIRVGNMAAAIFDTPEANE